MKSPKTGLGEFLSKIRESRYSRYLLALPVLLLFVLFFTEYVVTVSLVIASMLGSVLVKKTGTKRFGAELFTFTMIIVAVNFGAVLGAFTGFFLLLFHIAIAQLRGGYLTWVIPGYFVAGLLVPLLGRFDIFTTGAIVVLGLQGFFLTMTLLFSPKRAFTAYLPYASTNIAFNLFLFWSLAPVVMGMM